MGDFVNLRITSTVNSFTSERRFGSQINVNALKNKLELISGSLAEVMKLELYDADDHFIASLTNGEATLAELRIQDNYRIHILDSTLKSGELEDLSSVEKYTISEDDYGKRTDSVRAWKQKMKAGGLSSGEPAAEDPDERKKRLSEEKVRREQEDEALCERITAGSRCEVRLPEQARKLGEVTYVGKTKFKEGFWVGIKYDEPVGKNDGSVQGVRYFECPQKYGGFVKPQYVNIDNFEEEDDDLDEI